MGKAIFFFPYMDIAIPVFSSQEEVQEYFHPLSLFSPLRENAERPFLLCKKCMQECGGSFTLLIRKWVRDQKWGVFFPSEAMDDPLIARVLLCPQCEDHVIQSRVSPSSNIIYLPCIRGIFVGEEEKEYLLRETTPFFPRQS